MAWLFTCRHGYEAELCDELTRLGAPAARPLLAGLVEVQLEARATAAELAHWDPVYALQVLADVRPVHGESISQLADATLAHIGSDWLHSAGRWQVHVLVPGQLKGQPRPQMQQRAALLAKALRTRLAACTPKTTRGAQVDRLLQVLLLDNGRGVSSAAWLHPVGPSAAWPSLLPAGLADPADDDAAPSSAFRKLREALACMGEQPGAGCRCADLGASPGGWTHVLRQCGAAVFAVDRAPLAAALMRDAAVHFVQGDAFTWRSDLPIDWVVSDVIAYPERVLELIGAWCRDGAARRVVLQMKFKGGPDWEVMQQAVDRARSQGWQLRGKHFFNDKHEVTWMGWPVAEDPVSGRAAPLPMAPLR